MRNRSAAPLLASLALALLPAAAAADQATCGNAAASLARMAGDPTYGGDEAFFKLPTGPANVMFLYDQSGSMDDLPQCPLGWSNSNNAANEPCRFDLTDPARPNGQPTMVSVRGTCAPGTDGSATGLAWMEAVTPRTEYADPGRANTILVDRPAWGNGCVGDACLFDPGATYFYDDWNADATAASNWADRRAHDDPAQGLPATCVALDGSGTPRTMLGGAQVDLGDACRTCMATRGFYLYELYYVSRTTGRVADRWNGDLASSNPAPIRGSLFKGTFLNGNPPKFVTARKVVKDVAWMDDTSVALSKFDQVRMGLTILDTSNTGTRSRARIVVPLGPSKTAFPPTRDNMKQARQAIISVLNQDTTVYPTIDGGAISPGFFDPTNDRTPLASALFNVGQYFSNVGFYTASFGAAYQLAQFSEKTAGTISAPWVTADNSVGMANTCSVCWACQTNSVILITDGMPNTEITLPATVSSYDNAAYNLTANCGSQTIGGVNYTCGSSPLPRVASWLRNNDIRSDMTTGGRQALTTHTVGFAINDNTALKVLRAAANMGGGLFQRADSASQLADAVYNALNQSVMKESTFSAASAASLQTVQTAAAEAYLTRFRPMNTVSFWQGHVFQGGLFDEFLNGCDPAATAAAQPTVSCGGRTVSANFNEDEDPVTGRAVCTGVFLIDRECQEISEDPATGKFIQRATGNPAVFEWDAGEALSNPSASGYRSASARNISTWIGGARVSFTSANAATLRPYLNIDAGWCNAFLTRLGIPIPADPTLECANQVIHFVRGWDVLDYDTDGCRSPGHPGNPGTCPSGTSGEERDWRNWTPNNHQAAAPTSRGESNLFWKLGDVFHSSPGVVTAPIDEFRCLTSFEKQCVATIFSPPDWKEQTAIDSCSVGGNTVDAYECWRQANRERRRVVLVGGNDGMLHAFDAGDVDRGRGLDPTGSYSYLPGNGGELWAFIPPDLLPKLRLMLDSHQYMADGSVMVRDVWVDGGATGNPNAKNGRKEQNEFHTVAIFGERGGGTRFHALDVSDPASPPVLLWSFPENGTENDRLMGHTWSDFAPKPPPIGPVRIASGSEARGFEERWVVMLNGGYDPALVKGRAVFMVDVWTGRPVWRFTDADFKQQLGHGRRTSMFPVAAGIGMMVLGDTTPASRERNGFFDTASWGDLGGNVFVARFREPGTLDGSGLATNWFAARAFEQGRRSDDRQLASDRNEFFYMTASVYESATQTMRLYLGSGNRERLMSQGPSCGTDNLMACCQGGCSQVDSTVVDDAGACNLSDTFSCSSGFLEHDDPTSSSACGAIASCAAAPGNNYSVSASVSWSCGGTSGGASSVTRCNVDGVCTLGILGDVASPASLSASQKNRFYGFWAYGGSAQKQFDSQATARTFDENRFTDGAFGGTCSGPRNNSCRLVDVTQADVRTDASASGCLAGTVCKATLRDPGWFYEFGDVCQQASCSPAPPWSDEKTSANANVASGCTSWSGFRPFGMSTSTDPCSGNLGTPVSYTYLSDFISGTPRRNCGAIDDVADPGRIRRVGTSKSVTSPPQGATTRITFAPDGTIRYTMLEVDGSKTRQTKVRDRQEAAEAIYWLDVDPALHQCRHVSGAACP